MKLELKKRIVKTLFVCRRNMDVEESEHSKSGIVRNVDVEKVNENQLD